MEDVEDIQTRGTLTEANLRKNLSKIFALPPTTDHPVSALPTIFEPKIPDCQLKMPEKCQKNTKFLGYF
jgi:hypothetical protein